MAAVLACGPGAVLSHISAAALWGLLSPESGPIHISLPSQSGRRRRSGIRIHRCASLASPPSRATADPADPQLEARATLVTRRRGIPVTTVPRTIADLRHGTDPKLVRRALRQAQLAGHALPAAVPRDRTRSDLEGDFLALCRRHRLPAPQVNVPLGRWTVDFLWPAERLAVETDGDRFHRGALARADDRARDLDLRARGYRVHRYGEEQVRGEPEMVAADLRRALASSPERR
jgi:very-short-patch-repair endonuclease